MKNKFYAMIYTDPSTSDIGFHYYWFFTDGKLEYIKV